MGNMLLITFEDVVLPKAPRLKQKVGHSKKSDREVQLEQQLLFYKERLQTTIGEMETAQRRRCSR